MRLWSSTFSWVLLGCLIAGVVSAEPTTWWEKNYGKMFQKDLSSTWMARQGDSLADVMTTMFGIPPTKTETLSRVSDAIMQFQNALESEDKFRFADYCKKIENPGSLTEDTVYYVPSPEAIDRILKGENPVSVMYDEIGNPKNEAQLNGSAGQTPLHTYGLLGETDPDHTGPAAPRTPQEVFNPDIRQQVEILGVRQTEIAETPPGLTHFRVHSSLESQDAESERLAFNPNWDFVDLYARYRTEAQIQREAGAGAATGAETGASSGTP